MRVEALLLAGVFMMTLVGCYTEEKVKNHFGDYDINGDGRLERMEYVKIMQKEDIQNELEYE